MGWCLKLAALILAILSFIGLGIIDMRGLEARIKTVEDRTEILQVTWKIPVNGERRYWYY